MRVLGVGVAVLCAACGDDRGKSPDAAAPTGDVASHDAPGATAGTWIRAGTGHLLSLAADDGILVSTSDELAGHVERIGPSGEQLWRRSIDEPHPNVRIAGSGLVAVHGVDGLTFETSGTPRAVTASYREAGFAATYDLAGNLTWARAIASTSALESHYPPEIISDGMLHVWSWGPRTQALHVEGATDIVWSTQTLVSILDAGGTALRTMQLDGGRAVAVFPDQTTLLATKTELKRMRTDGTEVFARALDSAHTVTMTSFRPTSSGGFAHGTFTGTTTFAPGEPSSTVLQSTGTEFVVGCGGFNPCPPRPYSFVASYGLDGALRWARRPAGVDNEAVRVLAIAPRPDGGVDVVGSFRGDATVGTQVLHAGDDSAVFVARLDPDGALVNLRATHGFGCLDVTHVAMVSDGMLIGAQGGGPSIGAGCHEDLVIRDGAVTTQPTSATSTHRWYVLKVPD